MGDRLGTPGAVGFIAKFRANFDKNWSYLSHQTDIIDACRVHAGTHAQNISRLENDLECSRQGCLTNENWPLKELRIFNEVSLRATSK